MHNAIPLIVAALIAVAIIVIGCFYLVSPERISGTFGLKPPKLGDVKVRPRFAVGSCSCGPHCSS